MFCNGCRGQFESQARFDRHLLWCVTQSTTINAGTSKTTRPRVNTISSENIPPLKERTSSGQKHQQHMKPLAEASRPLQPATTMYAALHRAPSAPPKQAMLPLHTHLNNSMLNQLPSALSVATPRTELASGHQPAPCVTNRTLASVAGKFACQNPLDGSCKRSFDSEQAVKEHQRAVHGGGSRLPDFPGKNSGILTSHAKQQLQKQGLLRSSSSASTGAPCLTLPISRAKGPSETAPLQGPRQAPPPPPGLRPMILSRLNTKVPLPSATSGQSAGGPAETDQATFIYGKIVRLRIQSDITIQNDGNMLCGGIAWTRIGVAKQGDVVRMFDQFTHLPTKLQIKEYLPAPKTFKDEYQVHYPADDFRHSPDRIPDHSGHGVVALSCSKIVLHNGCQEAVKIAVVDVLSCRILMSFLIWTDTKASVKDWRPRVTGLSNIRDIEAARQAGYKVLKGWQAARAALWKFIDKETIILGYNLRADFDTLRMIHGRAVDIAKSVEKAAAGPLSRAQLSLDSLCREFPGVALKAHATFGRDCLVDAFAIREFGLWMIKQGDELVIKAKSKSREYQIFYQT
jgi:hypothetical protein